MEDERTAAQATGGPETALKSNLADKNQILDKIKS